MLRYLAGSNCSLVLMASNGFVSAVANVAASMPLVKLILAAEDVEVCVVDDEDVVVVRDDSVLSFALLYS